MVGALSPIHLLNHIVYQCQSIPSATTSIINTTTTSSRPCSLSLSNAQIQRYRSTVEMTTESSPSLPWKTRIALTLISALTDACSRPNGKINRRILGYLDFKASPNPKPVNGVKSFDITVDSSRNLWFRLFVPTTTSSSDESLPIIVFFHGGGFAFLSANSKAYDVACRRFARRTPAVVVSVNYRLSPEHKFPSQYEDGIDVLKFLDRNDSDFSQVLPENADLSKCFLAGDSAGGNIAHHVARIASEKATMLRKVRVVGLIAIQPFFGGEERTEAENRLVNMPLVSVPRSDWAWKAFLPDGSSRDHEAANVSGPNSVDISGLENFPKTLVVVGGYDPLKDWQRRYYNWLKKSGKEAYLKEYPDSIHAFYIFPELPECSSLFAQVVEFINN